ncbi:hypothetical protein J437_LFUL003853 [Ladona fulva]|uniref:Uncharacterized protein n=1 Tax=Ladona fulva TaxID=123851 RepID=A0A8K0P4U1_LADFU|nr:hypothetical protein J437_LFUL003853 [Ladona fulva]
MIRIHNILNVAWRSNSKLWMAIGIMTEWLNVFNQKMKRLGCKTTSVCQPLDQGSTLIFLDFSNAKESGQKPNWNQVAQSMQAVKSYWVQWESIVINLNSRLKRVFKANDGAEHEK